MSDAENSDETSSNVAPRVAGARIKRRLLAVLVLVLSSVLWLWPFLYLLQRGQSCGADIGIGLYGFPATFIGTISAIFMIRHDRTDRVVMGICVISVVLGLLSFPGIMIAGSPYRNWLGWAVDAWYGSC